MLMFHAYMWWEVDDFLHNDVSLSVSFLILSLIWLTSPLNESHFKNADADPTNSQTLFIECFWV